MESMKLKKKSMQIVFKETETVMWYLSLQMLVFPFSFFCTLITEYFVWIFNFIISFLCLQLEQFVQETLDFISFFYYYYSRIFVLFFVCHVTHFFTHGKCIFTEMDGEIWLQFDYVFVSWQILYLIIVICPLKRSYAGFCKFNIMD